jgi:hypothetical protein
VVPSTRLDLREQPRIVVLALRVTTTLLRTRNRQEDDHEQKTRDGQDQDDFDKGETLLFLKEITHLFLTFH